MCIKNLFRRRKQTDCARNTVVPPKEPTPVIQAPESYSVMMYGQCRTFADIVKVLNQKNHYRSHGELMHDFGLVIEKYQKRGSVNQDSLDIIEKVIADSNGELFGVNGFDFERFIEKLENVFAKTNGELDIDIIYSRRQMAKLLILLKTLNDICHYTQMSDLIDDLTGIATGRFYCGDNSFMNDPYSSIGNYPINWFVFGLYCQWSNITINGVLDNQLLEKVMFTDHASKVSALGIEQVVANDYEAQGPCHPEVFYPKEIGTGPVYVYSEGSRKYVKACGEGKGPRRAFGRYEMELIKPILQREVSKGNYRYLNNHYVPVGTCHKPVFQEYFGRLDFASMQERKEFQDIWEC